MDLFLNKIIISQAPSNENDEIIRRLKTQISTLSASLSTISAEKSRCESSFQQDRKRLIQEKDDVKLFYQN